MAVAKLLSRVVNPKLEGVNEVRGFGDSSDDKASILHNYTYGITSDPLLQFACFFSAIIHDLDHPGVPNAQLLKEQSRAAEVYEQSIAEQNSFDLAWNLFMDDQYKDFRMVVCEGKNELDRFRQIVINVVMATDIMDKELNGFRARRWERAFGTDADIQESEKDKVDRKATIVIEHMIQAADVAHTMQHWHIYQKWNALLFQEMHQAFTSGRSNKDPSDFWYKGEIAFFDHYIIPLAKKLAECDVFGVASSEHLGYAEHNRQEWQDRGQQIVAEYVQKIQQAAENKEKAKQPDNDKVENSIDNKNNIMAPLAESFWRLGIENHVVRDNGLLVLFCPAVWFFSNDY